MNKIYFQRFNTVFAGIVAGILLPVIIYFILYFAKVQEIQTTLFSNRLLIGNLIPILISHCILPNIILFFIFNGINWINASKGILGTTVALTVIIFAIKLVFMVV